MKNIIIFALLFVFYSCNSEETVQLILKEYNGKEHYFTVSSTATDITIQPYKKAITTIINIEKLKNLKRLLLDINRNLDDLDFFKNFKALEILQLTNQIKNLVFLKYLKNLRILCLNTGSLYENDIDLIDNQKVEYLEIQRINIKFQNHYFNLKLKNIPKTLKYFNIKNTRTEKITMDFIESIQNIPCVLIDKELYLQYKEYFDQHSNFTFDKPENVLPLEFLNENLLTKKSEYEFF